MRVPWKVLGLAGIAGVAATGVVVARKRRAHTEYDPEELRSRLHERLARAGDDEVSADAGSDGAPADVGGDAPASAPEGGDAQPGH